MSGEKDLEQLKREAAAKAKELAKQRRAGIKPDGQTDQSQPVNQEEPTNPKEEDLDLAKRKAAAAAKAKAAALAKMKANEQAEGTTPPGGD
ncbi:NADH-quinone oxidoreductase subunit C, partial [Bacillus sp. T33-2]